MPIRGILPLDRLRIRPEDECRHNGVGEPSPPRNTGYVVSRPVVLAYEDDVANNIEKTEQSDSVLSERWCPRGSG